MKLPDLNQYRSDFQKEGVVYPLSPVLASAEGLLSELPSAPVGKHGWPWTEETRPDSYDTTISWPKISIITPSYNQGEFIEATIRSILLQNYPNLEFIVIDGCSNDETISVLEKYAPWISYRQSKKDNGQAHAINLGFSLASGEYYAWINSDDYYLKDVFHLIAGTFLKHKVDFIYGYGHGFEVAKNSFNLTKVPPHSDYFIKIPSLVQPSCFWKAKIHQPLWEEMHCALDFELWLRMVKGKKRKRIKKPLSVANVHDAAKTSDPKMQAKWHEDHVKMWSADAHGSVPEWKRIIFINRIRMKIYSLLKTL